MEILHLHLSLCFAIVQVVRSNWHHIPPEPILAGLNTFLNEMY